MAFEKVGGEGGRDFPPRPMIKGDWACSECGAKILELPFEPAPDRPIYCRDCWSKKRNQFRR
jgi:CxxC-x17-CxxC domain-containing protein